MICTLGSISWPFVIAYKPHHPLSLSSLLVLSPAGFFTQQIERAEIQARSSHSTTYLSRTRSRQELDDLEQHLSEHENRLLQMNNSHETMQRRYLELTELKHVLKETSDFFEEVLSDCRQQY